jgi:membrane protease subunit HflK
MAWNEPGGGKPRDPWHDNGGKPSPDLDALARRVRDFFNRLFGGGSNGTGGAGGAGGRGNGIVIAIVGILIAWCVIDSWAVVDAQQQGVVLRFGKFSRVMAPGFNLKWPRPVESVLKVDATQIRATTDQVRMLTRDENIVLVDFNVQYQVADATRFLFSVRDPDATLKQAAESAVREVIGANGLDSIMPDQLVEVEGDADPAANPSAALAVQAKSVLQATLERYNTGLLVTELNFQNVRPPQEVKEAFDDAISAREDRQRRSNEADAYANRVVPEARGAAAAIRAEAEGYKAERVARAQGDAQRFTLIEAEYRAAPEVTRERLYLETLQQVIAETPNVIDLSAGKNLLYLPVSPAAKAAPTAADPAVPAQAAAGFEKGGN